MTKRLFPRIRTSVPVSFPYGEGVEPGLAENASIRGMRVVAARIPSIGELVWLDVRLPSGRTTRVDARVVFVDEPAPAGGRAFAVELTHPNEEYAAFLGLLVGATVRKGSFRG